MMNTVGNNSYSILEQRLEIQRRALETLMKSDKSNKTTLAEFSQSKYSSLDSAEFSEESMNLCLNGSQSYESTYDLDFATGVVEFSYDTNTYTLEDGTKIPLSSVKKVDSTMAKTLQAEDNTLSLSTNSYYNYTDLEGNEYIFALSKASFSLADSEQALGDYTNEEGQTAVKTGLFISSLIHGSYGSFFTDSEQKEILNNLGITTGKFSISVDGKTSSTFYLGEDGTIHSESEIASKRAALADINFYEYGYTAEDTFIVDGQEFHPDENGHVIVPDNLGVSIKGVKHSDED